jgi:hypothetical protein
MENWKVGAAKALDPVLSEFLAADGLPLLRVLRAAAEQCVTRMLLDFGKTAISVEVDPNDDSLDISAGSEMVSKAKDFSDASDEYPWKEHIGKPFGWGWITINQQGYCDGLLVSFGDIRPQIMINAVASSIKIAALNFV